ncbi:MAG: hypothetical protein ABW061_26520 [Polyangiaceae bacterium]
MRDANTNEDASTRRSAAEHRRWLIGIAISIAFGTFGAVMAWLSYAARSRPSLPSSGQLVKPASADAEPTRAHRRRSDEHR